MVIVIAIIPLLCRINPVTGCVEEERPNPMDSMSEEQKEYEATKLIGIMDKLHRYDLLSRMSIVLYTHSHSHTGRALFSHARLAKTGGPYRSNTYWSCKSKMYHLELKIRTRMDFRFSHPHHTDFRHLPFCSHTCELHK